MPVLNAFCKFTNSSALTERCLLKQNDQWRAGIDKNRKLEIYLFTRLYGRPLILMLQYNARVSTSQDQFINNVDC